MRCHYDYLSAPDRDGVSPNSNRKYQTCLTCLIFTTLDRAASDVIPVIANESEQASLTGCCLLLQLKPGSHKLAMKAENNTHILFLKFVFHCETERAPGEPADKVDCPLFVFLL